MALGIPTLMSPVGVNKEIIQDGINGFLPRSEDEWFRCLSILIEDVPKRNSLGEAGRKTVLDKYSKKVWEPRYLELFDRLVS